MNKKEFLEIIFSNIPRFICCDDVGNYTTYVYVEDDSRNLLPHLSLCVKESLGLLEVFYYTMDSLYEPSDDCFLYCQISTSDDNKICDVEDSDIEITKEYIIKAFEDKYSSLSNFDMVEDVVFNLSEPIELILNTLPPTIERDTNGEFVTVDYEYYEDPNNFKEVEQMTFSEKLQFDYMFNTAYDLTLIYFDVGCVHVFYANEDGLEEGHVDFMNIEIGKNGEPFIRTYNLENGYDKTYIEMYIDELNPIIKNISKYSIIAAFSNIFGWIEKYEK